VRGIAANAEAGTWVSILSGMKTVLRVWAGVSLAAGAYALLVRPRMLRWGATRDEVRERSPGEDIIPDGERGSTMAVTVDAPPSAVWPWLVQMGYDRAGWYSWDRLDRFGIPSARRLHPEWQSLSVGQRLLATPDASHWFDVAALEPERFLALRMLTSGGRQYDPADPRPRSSTDFADGLWAFQLRELPGGRTRLIVTVHSAGRPRLLDTVLRYVLWEPAHFVMQLRQFGNLKRRAEGAHREARPEHSTRPSTDTPRGPQPQV
jgi:proline iminopeptidase